MRQKILIFVLTAIFAASFIIAAHAEEVPEIQITSVGVTGNSQITSEYILNVVDSKPGKFLSRDMIQADVQAIYDQGFFSFVDVDLKPEGGGAAVMFTVQENPIIESINFTGNSIYTSEKLMEDVFSQVGTVFNRTFFRNDLDRIQERYHKDGFVMVRVSDVQIQGGNIYVTILEPKVGDVIIQGNKRTKTYVIRREIKLKKGDIFNATRFRHQLSRLQSMGFFEDVNVNFDIPENVDDTVDLILTVKEKRTASIGLNVAYGSESGLAGGLTYSETNLGGRAVNLQVGFNEGREASYWLTLSNPYMDAKTFGWRIGARYLTYDDRYYYKKAQRQFDFDEKSWTVFAGIGKKFANENWSWFFTVRHQHAEYDDIHNAVPGYIDDLTIWQGNNQTFELLLTWNKLDQYASYPKGFVWEIGIEQAVEALGGDFSYTKYWTQARFYASLNKVAAGITDNDFNWTDENPLLFAARLRIGSSTEDELPAFARYSLGGMSSLRGYNSRSFEGSKMFLGNFEIRMPINQMLSLVAFYDIGNADESFNWSDYHDDYGIGVRVKTPFGNLRVDYAHGKEESKTYFGFGEMF
ncbi:MAG: BamA/TamA family outer membrane protein [Synergistaceae bacterium]|nr:BamA/TamA family outer membrane protein [Synergistaceae bacterium]